jgi:hypothetical protein
LPVISIAASFNSPRYRHDAPGLYQLLRNAKVIETDGIFSVQILVQDGKSVGIEGVQCNLHLGEEPSGLRLYVPGDQNSQELCFFSVLPEVLGDWLMRDPITQIPDKKDSSMIFALTSILSCNLSVVSRTLEHQSIGQVEITNSDEEEDHGEYIDTETLEAPRSQTTILTDRDYSQEFSVIYQPFTPGSISSTETPQTPLSDYDVNTAGATMGVRHLPLPHLLGRSSLSVHSVSELDVLSLGRLSVEDLQYRELLHKVVNAARRSNFPTQGAFDMSGLLDQLGGDSIAGLNEYDSGNRFRSTSQIERDKKIGAAGELYVSENLDHMGIQSHN